MHYQNRNQLIPAMIKSLKIGQQCTVHTSNNSMHPLINNNEQITLTRTRISTIKCHDIIALYDKSSDQIIVHRVILIKKKHPRALFITKGDNNLYPDELVTTNRNYLGKITHIHKPTSVIHLGKKRYHLLRHHTRTRNFPRIRQLLLFLLRALP